MLESNLVDDGRKNTLVVISAEVAQDGGQGVLLRPRQDTQANVDHLKIYGRPTTEEITRIGLRSTELDFV